MDIFKENFVNFVELSSFSTSALSLGISNNINSGLHWFFFFYAMSEIPRLLV